MTVTRVTAPSRLHFGLLSFGVENHPHQYGGVGLMLDQPGLQLEVRPAKSLHVSGPHTDRARTFAERVGKAWKQDPCCEIRILSAPPQHTGLGLGTQLGLAVAAGLAHCWNHTTATESIELLASAVGRGVRSAVGAHGFRSGGFLVDAGHAAPNQLGKLESRVDVPDAWRFVLLMPRAVSQPGLAGKQEVDAFRQTPAVPEAATQQLWNMANNELQPAVARSDFDAFSEAVYAYGHLAGECFSTVQHGAYATAEIAALIQQLRSWGYAGCGQSSWGPTVYIATRCEEDAARLAERIDHDRYEVIVSKPNNRGSLIETTTT